jgi:uncharacterized protein YraI
MDRDGTIIGDYQIMIRITDTSFASDGNRFAFIHDNTLYLGDLAAQTVYNLCLQADDYMGYRNMFGKVVWAPDGQSLAFLLDGYPILLNSDTLEMTVLQYRVRGLLGWHARTPQDLIPIPTPITTPTPIQPTPTITPTVDMNRCTLVTTSAVNLRQGAGVDFEQLGSRPAGDTFEADARAMDTQGQYWFRLTDAGIDSGLWVRSDFVQQSGNCRELPTGEATATPLPDSACVLLTLTGVNLRQGAGTEFPQMGSRLAGDRLQADMWSRDASGYIWWRLAAADADTGLWLREDFVEEQGNCLALPQQ